jgi:hypothetical protein
MGIVSIPRRRVREREQVSAQTADSTDWVNIAAGGTLLAGGLLLIANQRKAGTVMGVAGAALTLLGHQEAVREWWDQIPTYVEQVQNMIARVQSSMEELTVTRENLHQALTGTGR